MQKCYVCKSTRRQLLMLACNHDVCIKCAADNYFINTIQNQSKKDTTSLSTNPHTKSSSISKKENYFCQICLEVTKIDQQTINQLKQWYIMNVNPKSSSQNKEMFFCRKGKDKISAAKSKQYLKKQEKSKDRNQQESIAELNKSGGSRNQQRNTIRHGTYPSYQVQAPISKVTSKGKQRIKQYDQRPSRHQYSNQYKQQTPATDSNRLNKIQQNLKRNLNKYQMPQQYQPRAKMLIFYQQNNQNSKFYHQRSKSKTKQYYNPSEYQQHSQYQQQRNQRYSLKPSSGNRKADYQNFRQRRQYCEDQTMREKGQQRLLLMFQREGNIQRHSSKDTKSDGRSLSSKDKNRIMGSIVKRNQIKTNQGLKQAVIRAKDQQRKRINSYKSEQKIPKSYYYEEQNPNHQQTRIKNNYQTRIPTQIDDINSLSNYNKRQNFTNYQTKSKRSSNNMVDKRYEQSNQVDRKSYRMKLNQQSQSVPQQDSIEQKRRMINQLRRDREHQVYYGNRMAPQKGINRQQEKSSSNYKRQVYLDLIGNQHSLQDQRSYPNDAEQHMSRQQGQPRKYSNMNVNSSQMNNNNKKLSANHNTLTPTNPTTTNNSSSKSPPYTFHNFPTSSNQSLQKLYCNIHQDQQIIYYCLQCRLLICSQCALYGTHKNHNIHTLKKASFKLKQNLYNLITQLNSYLLIQQQKQTLLIQHIKQIKIQSNKQKQKIKYTFENFLKNVQNKYALILEQLEESEVKSLTGYNQQLEKCKKKCQEYLERKAGMKGLFDMFGGKPAAGSGNHELNGRNGGTNNTNMTMLGNQLTSLGNNPTNLSNTHRIYRQFDQFFQQTNSMTSQQRTFFNTNIEQLQSKILDYQVFIQKIKPQYQRIIYPTFFNNSKNQSSNGKNKQRDLTTQNSSHNNSNKAFFFRQQSQGKSRRESAQLQQSLRFSDTSLLIPQTNNSPKQNKHTKRSDDFLCEDDFIQENNLKSINLMIEKELTNSELSELKQNLKIAHVDTIVESIKQIEEILKQFRIQWRNYQVRR